MNRFQGYRAEFCGRHGGACLLLCSSSHLLTRKIACVGALWYSKSL